MVLPHLVGALLQLGLAALVLTAAILAPPTHGALLAVPMEKATVAAVINIALAHDANVQGPGPLANTVILLGDRERLAAPLRAHGVVLLAAAPGLCGS